MPTHRKLGATSWIVRLGAMEGIEGTEIIGAMAPSQSLWLGSDRGLLPAGFRLSGVALCVSDASCLPRKHPYGH